MATNYKGYELNDAGDQNWASREINIFKSLIDITESNASDIDAMTQLPPVTISSNYMAINNDFILADATGGSFDVTLPLPVASMKITIKKIDSSGNKINVNSTGGAEIDNNSSMTIDFKNTTIQLISDGEHWWIV